MLETSSRGGAKKTAIMYKSFLSYRQLQEYLTLLVDADMLEYVKQDKIYNTTAKGQQFLKMYYQVDSMVPRENMLTKIMPK